MGLNAQQGLFMGLVGFGLSFIVGCWTKPSTHESILSIPTSASIGTIAARQEVLSGWMAVHNHQWMAAKTHFQRAIQLDPHPSIQQLPNVVEKATLEQERKVQQGVQR